MVGRLCGKRLKTEMQHETKKPKIDVETVYGIIFSMAWVLFHLYAGRPWDGWEDKQVNFLTFTFGPLLVYWGFWFFKKRGKKWPRKPF